MVISPHEREILDRLVRATERQSIYRSLHLVGDDMVKSSIDDMLKELLPPETYTLVEAIFKLNTDDKILEELMAACEDEDG